MGFTMCGKSNMDLPYEVCLSGIFPVTNRVFAQDVCHSLTPPVGRSLRRSVRRSVGHSFEFSYVERNRLNRIIPRVTVDFFPVKCEIPIKM